MANIVGTRKWAQREANKLGQAVWCYRSDEGIADGGGYWVYPKQWDREKARSVPRHIPSWS